MLLSNVFDYMDAYILVSGARTIDGAVADYAKKTIRWKKWRSNNQNLCTLLWLYKRNK